MKVEIWSDIVCPFCYIGKRHFERALATFSDPNAIKVEWKSFQLDPGLPKGITYPNTYQYLAERKGMSLAQAREATAGVVASGKHTGILLDFDRAIVTNTWDAHRLVHLAQHNGRGNEVEEALFRAHFTDGKDVSDHDTLIELASSADLAEDGVATMLNSEQYAEEVAGDIQEARDLGIRGVPFFVFNRKYAVSGAQPSEVFLQTLQKSFDEWRNENPELPFEVNEGPSCSPDGTCD